jgi:hypothetical protein
MAMKEIERPFDGPKLRAPTSTESMKVNLPILS